MISRTEEPLTQTNGTAVEEHETLDDDCILIAGAGPVGLMLATSLAYFGVRSVILERNETTTIWPKMDLTNARSMEILRKLGLADSLRRHGVPSEYPYTCYYTSGLHRDRAITKWELPSVDAYSKMIKYQNDGAMPLEPYQRLSQAVFEAWLKRICVRDPMIDLRYGWKVEMAYENAESVVVNATELKTGRRRKITTRYVVGCDGASSRIRKSAGIDLVGGPIERAFYLVHFKSRDLSRLQKQGQFWHLFFLAAKGFVGAAISQDEKDTWTVHMGISLDTDISTIDPHEAVYKVLGGNGPPFPIKIDEILVKSSYRPNLAVVNRYLSDGQRIMLAGDSAHQNIPSGGYGMNMGLQDAFCLSWKLASCIKGQAGPQMLSSYEQERRPVALMSVERSGYHMSAHLDLMPLLEKDGEHIDLETSEGRTLRRKIHEHYQIRDRENKDLGVEMGYVYSSDTIISSPKDNTLAFEFNPEEYEPSTRPGLRAPHVFLEDGTPIFDLYGKFYTLVDFCAPGSTGAAFFVEACQKAGVSHKHLKLLNEKTARALWENDLVLVRPDGHVAWRGDQIASSEDAHEILNTILGFKAKQENGYAVGEKDEARRVFSATVGTFTQDENFDLQLRGEFQK